MNKMKNKNKKKIEQNKFLYQCITEKILESKDLYLLLQ